MRHELQPVYERAQKAEIGIDRKVLADIAVHDRQAFAALAGKSKAALSS